VFLATPGKVTNPLLLGNKRRLRLICTHPWGREADVVKHGLKVIRVGLVLVLGIVAGCGPASTEDPACSSVQECDDGNPCTQDVCAPAGCQHDPVDGTCSDADSCTTADRCVAGSCTGDPLDGDGDGYGPLQCGGQDCDDRDPAIHPAALEGPLGAPACSDQLDNDCDGLTDQADETCSPCETDSDCDDGLQCNGQETCSAGVCVFGTPTDCRDNDPCTTDTCIEGGGCEHAPASGADCDDGDPCTSPDLCLSGLCQPGEITDADRDGDAALACGGTDCNDLRFEVNPAALEGLSDGRCIDGLDNDCDGLTDSQEAACDAGQDEYQSQASLDGSALRSSLLNRIDGHHSLGYDGAREYMFSELDNEQGEVECVYTGQRVQTWGIPQNDIMNTEHTWCQSWGADSNPAKADLHHLYPTMSGANSRRGNLELGWVIDSSWSQGGAIYGDDVRGQRVFEPRNVHKGDAARALFYFSVRYEMSMPDYMEGVMRLWNVQDPPDAHERSRCGRIETRQNNRNHFIDRPGFIDRISDF
jgi:deoxyribonuclease-1